MAVRPIANASITVIPDFGKFESAVRSFSSRAAGAMGSLTSAVTGVGLAGLVTFGLKSAASLEQAQVGFQTLLGSGKKAQAFLADLQKFAANTPFELPGLIESSRTLIGVGISAKQVVPLLTAFGDAAGAVGVGQEAFQRIILATSQAVSAGKFQVGDLNQIMTNGIPIYTILSQAMGKPVSTIRQLASEGKLLSKDVLPLLQKQMEKDYGGAMAKQSQTLAGVWSTLKDNVAIGLANAIKPLVPLLEQFVPRAANAASAALGGITKGVATFISAAQGVDGPTNGIIGHIRLLGLGIRALITAYQDGTVTSNGFIGVMERVGVFIRAAVPIVRNLADQVGTFLVNAFRTIAPIIANTVGWLNRNRDIAAGLAIVIGTLVAVTRAHAAVLAVEAAGGLVKYIAQVNIVSTVTKVWAAVQWVLNSALLANPIGIVIGVLVALGAALYLAWTRSSTFRAIVIGAWDGIKAAVSAVGNWFTGTLWPSLQRAWQGIASGAMWLWHNVFEPVWNGIKAVVKVVSAILQLEFAIIVAVIRNVLAPAAMWLWHNVFAPVFNAIKNIVTDAINVLKAVFNGIVWYVRNVLAPVYTWLWHNVIGPVFNGIKNVVSAWWGSTRGILSEVIGFLKDRFVNSWRNTVTAIRVAWDLLKQAAKAPVVFVVNSVINPLIGGFNKLAGIFHTPKIDKIPGFAEGGRIPGQPSSTDNRIAWLRNGRGQVISNIKVATGEFIVNARDTARALPLLQWINNGMKGGPSEVQKRLGRPLTEFPGDGSEGWAFAGGGLVGFLDDIWGALSNPVRAIKDPLNNALGNIPGGGLFRDVIAGMGHKLIDGFMHFIETWGGGNGIPGTGNVLMAQNFVRAQAGKPYVWASAGPGGYDCSGIVSAVWNVFHGRNPYSHIFSTESLPGPYFMQGPRNGPLVAGWSHPGQPPAGNDTGHMAGEIGGLRFESTGSRGVHIGPSARSVSEFANVGVARANGGLVELAKIARADFGSVTLAQGHNLIYNGTGQPEPLTSPSGPARMHPDDIAALAVAIGSVVGNALVSTVPATRLAARKIGPRPR